MNEYAKQQLEEWKQARELVEEHATCDEVNEAATQMVDCAYFIMTNYPGNPELTAASALYAAGLLANDVYTRKELAESVGTTSHRISTDYENMIAAQAVMTGNAEPTETISGLAKSVTNKWRIFE